MKKSSIFLAAFVCMVLCSAATLGYNRVTTSSGLRASAQSFVEENFPDQAIAYTEFDTDHMNSVYEVRLNSGLELVFDMDGNWNKIDCHYCEVPAHFVPVTIADYVKTHFPGTVITKIDKEHYGYDIELSNHADLSFDAEGMILYLDD